MPKLTQSERELAWRLWRYGGRSYRGDLVLFVNPRGDFNVINQVALDDYLRGVLPKEMGPELYPQLEALKAQAIAARTYALHNLGEFADEGYDICATPRCQVYGGKSSEHPMSDRAVLEPLASEVGLRLRRHGIRFTRRRRFAVILVRHGRGFDLGFCRELGCGHRLGLGLMTRFLRRRREFGRGSGG